MTLILRALILSACLAIHAMAQTASVSQPPPPLPAIDPAVELKGAALLAAIQKGGYVLHMRHAEAIVGIDNKLDVTPDWQSHCELQRNLTDTGRDAARRVGEALRHFRVPISEIFTSEFCRARETADLLALGKPSTRLPEFNLDAGQPLLKGAAALRLKRFATPPPAGTNTLVVAHVIRDHLPVENAIAGSGFCEIIVYRPDGKGETVPVGRIEAEDWKIFEGARGK